MVFRQFCKNDPGFDSNEEQFREAFYDVNGCVVPQNGDR